MNFTLDSLLEDAVDAWTNNFWFTLLFWLAVGSIIYFLQRRDKRKREED